MSKSKPKKNPENRKSKLSEYNQYIKYSGLAFQMALLVAAGYWIGKKIDSWLNTSYPVFMIIMIFLFLFASIYSLIKNLPKD